VASEYFENDQFLKGIDGKRREVADRLKRFEQDAQIKAEEIEVLKRAI
jgi:hypothetical protein